MSRTLIKKLQRKDQKCIEDVFNQYKSLVFYTCYNILNSREDAEDILQEVFIEFFNNASKLNAKTDVKLALVSLAKRRAIDQYRKNAKNPEVLSEDIESYAGNNPESELNLSITLHNLLSPQDAKILVLKIVYDFTFNEIAEELNLTIGESQSRYYRNIKVLKKHYKELGLWM